MSLAANIALVVEEMGADAKLFGAHIGDLSTLSSTAKDSLVNAINELHGLLTSAGVHINDAGVAGNTTDTFSVDHILSLITAAKQAVKDDILGGASPAFDTLKELQTALESDQTAATELSNAVGNRVRFDAAQALTADQKTTALTNIGAVAAADVGDVTTDFVALYNAAKTAS